MLIFRMMGFAWLSWVNLLFHSPPTLHAQEGQGQSLEALVKRLSATDSNDRRKALFEIGTFGPRAASAVPSVIRMFSDSEPGVAEEAARTLARLGDAALGALLEASEARDQKTRWLAVSALAESRCDRSRTVPVFLRALRDQDEDVREAAVNGLATARDQVALAPLMAVLRNDPSIRVRCRTAGALGQFGRAGKVAIPGLIDVLKKEAENDDFESLILCRNITRSLFSIGPDSIPSLTALVQSRKKHPGACECSLIALLNFAMEDPKLLRKPLPVLRELLGEPGHRVGVLKILWEMKKEAKDALPDIMALLPIASDFEKTFAAGALYSITESAKLPVSILIETTRSKSAGARFSAVRRLGEIGRPASAALPEMIRLCKDPDVDVRLAAVQELPKIDNSSAQVYEAVESRLSDESSSVSRAASQSLEALQPPKEKEDPDRQKPRKARRAKGAKPGPSRPEK